ncbi:NADPH-dependent FMN reductase [Lacinutrix sp. Bg11-31]|uniref:NADPH-dependent FMN reductase n=1 Tax=Lacinutrix sp. Bg11-31 TaxID=2057808 RepID=UPI000C3117B2|nr:NAD(P)H-dependent oxidoreductase [Lacinutrix sp. Bg11-31]AUC81272.1 NADPH-dependent FMN reductase [Lacinutrix sp. Bg11-31]
MKNILVFAGSNSKTSINKQLATFVGASIEAVGLTVLDLNNFNLPLYGIDLENEKGIPKDAEIFLDHIIKTDGIILSLAEHNGAYATVFKNLIDWLSRIDGKFWNNKPMLLMATSPGGRGGQSVLEIAKDRFPRHNANVVATFSLPSFNDNFSEEGIKDQALNKALNQEIEIFKDHI